MSSFTLLFTAINIDPSDATVTDRMGTPSSGTYCMYQQYNPKQGVYTTY